MPCGKRTSNFAVPSTNFETPNHRNLRKDAVRPDLRPFSNSRIRISRCSGKCLTSFVVLKFRESRKFCTFQTEFHECRSFRDQLVKCVVCPQPIVARHPVVRSLSSETRATMVRAQKQSRIPARHRGFFARLRPMDCESQLLGRVCRFLQLGHSCSR